MAARHGGASPAMGLPSQANTLVCSLVVLLMVHCSISEDGDGSSLVIETDKGKIQGFKQTLTNNKGVKTFLGIPYAEPPTENLRFKHPEKRNPWSEILDTTKLPKSCIQSIDDTFGNFTGSDMWNANTPQSEDCLYLNVWVPDTPTQNKSVIVWIYGGGFYSGTSTLDIYDAKYLAAENDVIVVSMQYRVGPFGFLALNTDEAPGNAGLYDQRMALEWVNTNIFNFGGDPQSVTLMGESAGAVSVGLHLISEGSHQYFHRAILQSGSPTAGWGVLSKEEIWKRSGTLAENLNCGNSSSQDAIVACLRRENTTEFVSNEWKDTTRGIVQFPFVPIVDGRFITEDPRLLLRKHKFKKVPLLLGSNENEGTFFEMYQNSNIYKRDTDSPVDANQYQALIDNNMFKYYPAYPIELPYLGRQSVAFEYRNLLNRENGVENRKSIDRAVSDAYFVCPVNELALAYASLNESVYYYWFNQRWSDNPWPEWMGVLHADEIWFTFGHPLDEQHSFTEGERELSRKMMTYWSNIAKTGSPTTEENDWPQFTESEQKYRILSVDAITGGKAVGQFPRTEQCIFWEDFLPKVVKESCRLEAIETNFKSDFSEWKRCFISGWNNRLKTFFENNMPGEGSCKSCSGETEDDQSKMGEE